MLKAILNQLQCTDEKKYFNKCLKKYFLLEAKTKITKF